MADVTIWTFAKTSKAFEMKTGAIELKILFAVFPDLNGVIDE